MLNEGGQSVNYMYTCIGYTEKKTMLYMSSRVVLYICVLSFSL